MPKADGSSHYGGLAHHKIHMNDKSLFVKLPGGNVGRKLSPPELDIWHAQIQAIIDRRQFSMPSSVRRSVV
jgi:hypothetical protein